MLEHYISSGGKRLRCGYTTGSCAAMAAKAAAGLLLGDKPQETVSIVTPKGISVMADVCLVSRTGDEVICGVRKDAGDDIDATDGALVCAAVRKTKAGLAIEGGAGVGRVTQKGLDQPVGHAAINSAPRRMIAQELAAVCRAAGYEGGLSAVISVPEGEALAKRTFNAQLGIVGGISILGTSGIVEPQSLRALLDSLAVETRVAAANGARELIITPGNYGSDFVARYPALACMPQIKCANFFGEALDLAAQNGFDTVLVVAHLGKLVKLAGGIMDTHSRVADCRTELFAVHAALCGASRQLVAELMDAATSDACLALLDAAGLREPVLTSLLRKVQWHLEKRAAGAFHVGAVTFSNQYGLLAATEAGAEIIEKWSKEHE